MRLEIGDPRAVAFFEEPQLAIARVSFALGGLALAVGWERLRPFRCARADARHALGNVSLWALNAVVLQVAGAAGLFVAAAWAAGQQLGALAWLAPPRWLAVAITVLVLDGVSYGLHRAYHASPLLWRIHRVHHSDPRLEATTGVRFHPGEVLLSALLRLPVVIALGADPIGVGIFEGCLLFASQLQHADVRLSDGLDRWLRWGVVTPNVHRIHHSTERSEADSNYGTIITGWDRAFRSFRTEPRPEDVEAGLEDVPGELGVARLLLMPLRPAAVPPTPRAR